MELSTQMKKLLFEDQVAKWGMQIFNPWALAIQHCLYKYKLITNQSWEEFEWTRRFAMKNIRID
jgi:hypothetical protein